MEEERKNKKPIIVIIIIVLILLLAIGFLWWSNSRKTQAVKGGASPAFGTLSGFTTWFKQKVGISTGGSGANGEPDLDGFPKSGTTPQNGDQTNSNQGDIGGNTGTQTGANGGAGGDGSTSTTGQQVNGDGSSLNGGDLGGISSTGDTFSNTGSTGIGGDGLGDFNNGTNGNGGIGGNGNNGNSDINGGSNLGGGTNTNYGNNTGTTDIGFTDPCAKSTSTTKKSSGNPRDTKISTKDQTSTQDTQNGTASLLYIYDAKTGSFIKNPNASTGTTKSTGGYVNAGNATTSQANGGDAATATQVYVWDPASGTFVKKPDPCTGFVANVGTEDYNDLTVLINLKDKNGAPVSEATQYKDRMTTEVQAFNRIAPYIATDDSINGVNEIRSEAINTQKLADSDIKACVLYTDLSTTFKRRSNQIDWGRRYNGDIDGNNNDGHYSLYGNGDKPLLITEFRNGIGTNVNNPKNWEANKHEYFWYSPWDVNNTGNWQALSFVQEAKDRQAGYFANPQDWFCGVESQQPNGTCDMTKDHAAEALWQYNWRDTADWWRYTSSFIVNAAIFQSPNSSSPDWYKNAWQDYGNAFGNNDTTYGYTPTYYLQFENLFNLY